MKVTKEEVINNLWLRIEYDPYHYQQKYHVWRGGCYLEANQDFEREMIRLKIDTHLHGATDSFMDALAQANQAIDNLIKQLDEKL